MQYQTSKKNKGRNLIFSFRKKNGNRRKYYQKPTCTVIHKIFSKKDASMLIIQKLEVVRILGVLVFKGRKTTIKL